MKVKRTVLTVITLVALLFGFSSMPAMASLALEPTWTVRDDIAYTSNSSLDITSVSVTDFGSSYAFLLSVAGNLLSTQNIGSYYQILLGDSYYTDLDVKKRTKIILGSAVYDVAGIPIDYSFSFTSSQNGSTATWTIDKDDLSALGDTFSFQGISYAAGQDAPVQATAIGTTTPIPAAAWLLGSGLIGLIGVRKKKNA